MGTHDKDGIMKDYDGVAIQRLAGRSGPDVDQGGTEGC